MSDTIRFLGGAGTVTGSKFLLSLGTRKILVDCGLFQGLKELRLQNWAPFPVKPNEIDAVILTHAHLDHSGYLPILVRDGFNGNIYSTSPTRELTKVILADSGKLQEEDAARANEEGFSKHHPAKPLYTTEDAHRAMKSFVTGGLNEWVDLGEGYRFRFTNSGHILGSALVEIQGPDYKISFTGDLGREDPLLLPPPALIERTDFLVTESTYGDRLHSPRSPLAELAKIVNETVEQGGQLLIPAFAIGRTQDLLFLLMKLKDQCQIPEVPVFLDSPMGTLATEIFSEYPDWHRLSTEEVTKMDRLVTCIKSQQQSRELFARKASSIIIAGSGMLTGGRILSHLMNRLQDERNCVLLVGYQAAGTRGALLASGASELKIYGRYIPVRAQIRSLSSLSAHADQRGLLNWMGHMASPPKNTFVVHGEPQAADALRVKVQDALKWHCTVPKPGETFSLQK